MGIRIPKSKIIENLYTSGNEFVEKESYKAYKGYYCSVGEQFFSGKTFNPNAIEIVRQSPSTNKVNSFNAETLKYFYGASPIIKNTLTSPDAIRSIHFNATQEDINRGYAIRYFIKKQNTTSSPIKEVDKNTYDNLNNPIYTKVSLKWNLTTKVNWGEVDRLDTIMPGLKGFLRGEESL